MSTLKPPDEYELQLNVKAWDRAAITTALKAMSPTERTLILIDVVEDSSALGQVRTERDEALSRAESAELGCEIAYKREPTQAEGDAYDRNMGVIGECFVAMGGWTGRRCRACGCWVWGGPTACERCVRREERDEARDCQQDDVCAVPPGCQRHWEERCRELMRERDEARSELATERGIVEEYIELAKGLRAELTEARSALVELERVISLGSCAGARPFDNAVSQARYVLATAPAAVNPKPAEPECADCQLSHELEPSVTMRVEGLVLCNDCARTRSRYAQAKKGCVTEPKPAEPWPSNTTCPNCKGSCFEDGNTNQVRCQTCGARGVVEPKPAEPDNCHKCGKPAGASGVGRGERPSPRSPGGELQ
jgi:hypothetical protein